MILYFKFYIKKENKCDFCNNETEKTRRIREIKITAP